MRPFVRWFIVGLCASIVHLAGCFEYKETADPKFSLPLSRVEPAVERSVTAAERSENAAEAAESSAKRATDTFERLWWHQRYPDAGSLACAIHGEVLKVEKNPHHAEELVPLLANEQPIFRDGDDTIVTVRDAVADIFEELDDPAYWLGENAKVKMIACCPLEGGDCARVHIPALTEAQISRLRRKLGKLISKSN